MFCIYGLSNDTSDPPLKAIIFLKEWAIYPVFIDILMSKGIKYYKKIDLPKDNP